MHKEVKDYLSNIKGQFSEYFKGKRVLELGSRNYNGTPREFFEDCEYIGLDRDAGEAVDIVDYAHSFKDRKKYDVVISTEMLEHDKYAKESMKNALSLLKKGGLLIMTAAGVNRAKHCDEAGEDGYYKNISKDDVVEVFGKKAVIEEDEGKQDIKFYVLK